MIVIDLDNMDDFLFFLTKRLTNEIFFYVEKDCLEIDVPGKDEIRIVLHYLGKIDESRTALYQTKLKFKKGETKDHIYSEMKKVFEGFGNMKLISGRISELYISVA